MMMRTRILWILLFCSFTALAQKQVTWDDLAKVSFSELYNNDLGAYVNIPEFSAGIKALDGKKISIKGHVIPLDVQANDFVLSAFPFASCFFCGNSGPETVMELKLRAKGDFQTDEYLTFTGILRLNRDDIYSLNYILENAEVSR